MCCLTANPVIVTFLLASGRGQPQTDADYTTCGALLHGAVGSARTAPSGTLRRPITIAFRGRIMISRRLITGLLLFTVLWRGASALSIELNDGAPQSYIVRKGDTLWGIAGMYLQQPWRWPDLWHVNPQVDNPHLIYPGDELWLQRVDGEPRLVVRRGRDVKLTPNMRVTPLERAIPVIPLDQIDAFLLRHRIVDTDSFGRAAYVLAGDQGHLISAPGDLIFSRGGFPEGERVFGIYRPGQVYRDPVSQELLGMEARDIGSAELVSGAAEEVKELEIVRVTEEVRIRDRLLPMQERILDATFHPRPPGGQIEDGFMIAVDGGVSQIGTWDIVVINKGVRDRLEIGHVLAIYQSGEVVYDEIAGENVQLPDARAGLAMVFEVFEKSSYAIVLKANRPLKILDKVRTP
jgi:hypothetical protein